MKTKSYFIITIILITSSLLLSQVPNRKGWWKFDDASNITKATLGNDLEKVGLIEIISGPSTGNGAVRVFPGSYFKLTHGITPSPAAYVNEYTLQIDFKVKDIDAWRCFFQTSPDNSSDGDCFINTSGNIGVRATGYTTYSIKPNEWYRLVISVSNGNFYRYYLDGQLILDGIPQAIDGRFALENVLLIFADEDGEDGEIECAELGIWDKPLSSGQINLLGGFNHEIPKEPLQPNSLWKFDNALNLGESYYGYDLTLIGTAQQVEGPSSTNKAVRIDVGNHFKAKLNITSNGGGSKINEYTLKFDFRVNEIGKWKTFFQAEEANTSDGECFINTDGQIGVKATGYSTYKVIPKEWYRLVLSVKNGTHYRYYLDGQLLLEGIKQDIDSRFALDNTIILFGDNDGDDGLIDIAETAFWDRALNENEIKTLSGFGHILTGGSSNSKSLVGKWKFDEPFNLTKAEVGEPLELFGKHESVDGPTTSNFAVRLGAGSYYKVAHNIGSNGGGIFVNEYSIVIDFKIPSLDKWHCLYQTSISNSNDGDLFINTNGNIGTQATGYSTYSIKANEWYKLVINVQNGDHYDLYLDGNLIHKGNVQSIDGRFSLDGKHVLIFADEDGEDNDIDCAELSIYNYSLTANEIKTLGGYGHVVGVKEINEIPKEFSLSQNYPNPLNPSTTINYSLPKSENISLIVYDMLGREVQIIDSGFKGAGYYSIIFDASKLSSGIYFYRIKAGNYTETKKMLILK